MFLTPRARFSNLEIRMKKTFFTLKYKFAIFMSKFKFILRDRFIKQTKQLNLIDKEPQQKKIIKK